MGIFTRKPRPAEKVEARATYTQNSPELVRILGLQDFLGTAAAGVVVTTDKALGVPAVWAAVNFIAGTIAGLPLHVYRRDADGGRRRVSGGVAQMLAGAVNEGMSSFAWRKYSLERVMTTGRAVSFIERNKANKVTNLWPLEPERVTIHRDGWRLSYRYRDDGRVRVFEAAEVLDIPFMLKADGVSHYGPVQTCRDAIALSIAATEYGSRFFQGGGVPPFAVTGNFQSSAAMARAAEDLAAAVSTAATEDRQALVLPQGLDIKPIGGDPEKSQLVEVKRFLIEEIARVYSIPPTFLQDLTHGTFSNTEQQDLHFVKHTLKRWIEQIEQEMNLKLFGRGARDYVEFNVDGLLRGDYKTRMEGHAHSIQNGIATPNEVREIENRPKLDGGDRLMIQGATVPLVSQEGQGGGAEPQETGESDDV